MFLRGIGLGIVVTSFQGIFTKNFLEPEKIAISRSRITALLRSLIHVVPLGVAIFESVLNLRGHFIGSTFDRQNYLQFVAKAHEIAMQASLATILLSYIRYQITAGRGMPFGAVLSGIQFVQVSYLWSVELWSSILSKDFRLRKKIFFAILIIICITVAATAGPSSANLLIARQGLWPIASTYLAVNASFLDLWPDRLDEKNIDRECAVVRFESLHDAPRCPISDVYTMLEEDPHGSLLDMPLDTLSTDAVESDGAEFYRYLVASVCPTSSKDQFCGSIPQNELLDGFYMDQPNRFADSGLDGYQSMQKNYYQPYTIASCVTDIVKGSSDQTPLQFARISETDSGLKKDREMISIPGLTKGHFVKSELDDDSDFHVDWVDLPMDVFNTGIPGAVIVNFQDPNDSLRNITTCTLNAGWGSSTVMSAAREPETIYSHTYKIPSSWTSERESFDAYGYLYTTTPSFANISNFSYPQRRISVSKNWMEFLNPIVVLPDNSTGKYISLALSTLRTQPAEAFQPTEANMARLLMLLLTIALGETGTGHDWEGIYEPSFQALDLLHG